MIVIKHEIEPENYQKYPAGIENIPVRFLGEQGFPTAEWSGYDSKPAKVCGPVPEHESHCKYNSQFIFLKYEGTARSQPTYPEIRVRYWSNQAYKDRAGS